MGAADIEAAIGQSAKVKWTAGDRAVSPNGRDLGRLRDESYCAFGMEAGEMPLSDAIVLLGNRLLDRAERLNRLHAEGAEIEVYATLNKGAPGQVLSPAAISALANINASLGVDWA